MKRILIFTLLIAVVFSSFKGVTKYSYRLYKQQKEDLAAENMLLWQRANG